MILANGLIAGQTSSNAKNQTGQGLGLKKQ